jgi:hypothetical protein
MSAILVYGPSGWGKSHASSKLNPEETGIICSDMKDLPFRGAKRMYRTNRLENGKVDLKTSNYVETRKPASVLKVLQEWEQREDLKVVLIDTLGHVVMGEFMNRALEKGYEKWSEMAQEIYKIIDFIQTMSKHVIVIMHNEIGYDATGAKTDEVKTVGKLLSEKIDIPSLFTIVLCPYVKRKDGEATYLFRTQSDGTNRAKSPEGMFEYEIPNDYKLVIESLESYYL